MQRAIATVCFFFLLTSAALAQTNSTEKLRRIELMLESSGASQIGQQMADAMAGHMLKVLQTSNPELTDRVIAIAREELMKVMSKDLGPGGPLMTQIAAVYSKHFTDEEIDAFVAFYDSAAGRKLTASQSLLFQDTSQIGRAWGAAVAPELIRSIDRVLTREGIKIPKMQ